MKFYLLGLSFWLLMIFNPAMVKADLMNPDYYEKDCNVWETQIVCNYSRDPYTGKETFDSTNCKGFKNNILARELVGEGSSWGGRVKFCLFSPGGPILLPDDEFVSKYIIGTIFALLITLCIELFAAFIYTRIKKLSESTPLTPKNLLTSILFANIISLPLLWLIFYFIPVTFIFLGEVGVILFEAWFISKRCTISRKSSLLLSILINLLSWLAGTYIFGVLHIYTFFG